MGSALEQKIKDKILHNYKMSINLARQAVVNRAVAGLQSSQEEAGNLELSWLYSSDHLCLIISIFEKDKAEIIDTNLSQLNRQLTRLSSQSISTCINPGVLITIFAQSDEIDDATVQPYIKTVDDFLKDMNCMDTRHQFACENSARVNPADLYLRILNNSVHKFAPEAINASNIKKNRQQIVEEIESIINTQYHAL